MHGIFGGVVPELASREHYRHIGPLLDMLLAQSGFSAQAIDLVCVARGPGLLGSLLVGVAFAKALALGLGARFLGVNHLHAHLLAAGLEQELVFPCLGLVVSGGHSQIYRLESASEIKCIGRTLDDAAGEAFDKVGKALGLTYPAGMMVDKLAADGLCDPKLLPRPYTAGDSLDFSFSGLKTAAISAWEELSAKGADPCETDSKKQQLKDFCASFNLAIADTICAKITRALEANPDLNSLILAGGVAANSLLRQKLTDLMEKRKGRLIAPSAKLCTDNGLMIAYAGWLLARQGFYHPLGMESIPRGRKIPDDMLKTPL